MCHYAVLPFGVFASIATTHGFIVLDPLCKNISVTTCYSERKKAIHYLRFPQVLGYLGAKIRGQSCQLTQLGTKASGYV